MDPQNFFIKKEIIEGLEDEPIEEIVPIPRMYGGNGDFPIKVGSQESNENTDS